MKLGKAFSDSVISVHKPLMRPTRDEGQSWWLGMGRTLMFVTVLCVGFFMLLWRLFDLSVVQGHRFRALADGNRTRELIRHAPRGILLDRTGKPLVFNIPYYRLLKPCGSNSIDNCVTPLSREEGDALAKQGLPAGTFLEVDYRRDYLYPSALSHLLGYTGEITEKELQDEYYQLRAYGRGDRVGRTGAEAVYEDRLRGRDGKELVEVDAHGSIIRSLGRDREVAGQDIMLSVDIALQAKVAENFPKDQKGAVVVSKPATGELLALYSSPSFDLNTFSSGLSQKLFDDLVARSDQPLFDRAIGGVYPPGSTFKLVTALAALEEGAIRSDTTVDDVGVLSIGPFRFPNWYFLQYGKTDGLVNVVKALQRSNDIFFYKTGEWVGITKLVSWAHKVGIGKPLGVELGGEASGLMPDPDWKKLQFSSAQDKEARNDEWYLGDTYHVSIGQGYVLTTPLQVNSWTNVIASRGSLCRPTIKKATGDCKDLGIKIETIDLITSGMQKACEAGGTGWPLFGFRVSVACKTGTAEFGDPKNNTHAWFTVFAPIEDPEISVTVLVEGAGEGSSVAAPIAKKILEEWFGR